MLPPAEALLLDMGQLQQTKCRWLWAPLAHKSMTIILEQELLQEITRQLPTVFHVTGGSGTDISGADFTIAGRPTGAGNGGSIIFQTAAAGTSGTSLQSLSERMRIDQNGNVGIGTTSPTQKLDVNGNINISGTSAKIYAPEICLAGDCKTSWPTAGSGGGNASIIGTGGYIPQIQNSTLLNNSAIYQNGNNIGIGTNSPTQKLDVNGSINITGNLSVSGTSATVGGKAICLSDGTNCQSTPSSVVAVSAGTGATTTYSGVYTVHKFVGNGTFTVYTSGTVEYLVVAGGGSGSQETAQEHGTEEEEEQEDY